MLTEQFLEQAQELARDTRYYADTNDMKFELYTLLVEAADTIETLIRNTGTKVVKE